MAGGVPGTGVWAGVGDGVTPGVTVGLGLGVAVGEASYTLRKTSFGSPCAVAVSWYRNDYTHAAIEMLVKAGVKTNIHYVIGNNSLDEAIQRLKYNDFPKGINAVVFLLHKPTGQGTPENVLSSNDTRMKDFFAQFDIRHPFKMGMDSCTVPGILNHCTRVAPEALDTCEGARFSCYIGADLKMVPCSWVVRRVERIHR